MTDTDCTRGREPRSVTASYYVFFLCVLVFISYFFVYYSVLKAAHIRLLFTNKYFLLTYLLTQLIAVLWCDW